MHTTLLPRFAPELFTTVTKVVKGSRLVMTVYLDSFIQDTLTFERPTDAKLADKWDRSANVDQARVLRKVQISAQDGELCIERVELINGLWLDVDAA